MRRKTDTPDNFTDDAPLDAGTRAKQFVTALVYCTAALALMFGFLAYVASAGAR